MDVWQTPLGQATLARIKSQVDRDRQQKKLAVRQYAAARVSRLTGSVGSLSSSANSELHSSLQALRDRSRQLIRDSAYAKRARQVVVDNVIGTGIGMQPGVIASRGELRKPVNTAISDAFWQWAGGDSCHTGGQLHFCDLERQMMGQVFEAGEVIIRLHPMAFGRSEVPLALELIEPERLADNIESSAVAANSKIVQSVEVDRFYRPVAYWIRTQHPGEHRLTLRETDRAERVPAEQIMHLRIIDRWPQVRGVPWLHAVIGKLADINGYTEAEIVAARAASMYFGTIETDEDTAALGEEQDDGSYQLPLEPGMIEKLKPGEKLNFINPNRPNSALDPFLRYMLREMAAGIPGNSYESLSRDYSQSNYSSSRMALLEDRDSFRAIQQWFIRSFREPLHRVWLQQAVLAGAVPGVSLAEYATEPAKFAAVSFKPRGWSWVDPTKEVEAFKEAVKAGFTTVTDVISMTDSQGRDAEEVFALRRRELDELDELSLSFDTSPENYEQKDEPAPVMAPVAAAAPPADDKADDEAQADRSLNVAVHAHFPGTTITNNVPPSQLHVKAPIEVQAPVTVQGATIHVAAPNVENRFELPATTVNVAAPTVNVEPPAVTIENLVQVPATTVNVAAPNVNVEPPAVAIENVVHGDTIHVAAPAVTVENRAPEINPAVTVTNVLPTYEVTEQKLVRDSAGRVDGSITKRKRSN